MKKIAVFLTSLGLVATGLVVPSAAQDPVPPPVVPATVVLEDPFGDANGLNDQGRGATTGFQGDVVTPQDAGNASDIGKIWFTDDELTISVHIQTELPSPGSQGLRYDVNTAVTPDNALGCARFVAFLQGNAQGQSTTWQGPDSAKFFDACNDGVDWFANGVEAQVSLATLEDGTGVVTITAPKDASPFLATGQTLTGTTATTRAIVGADGTFWGTAAYIDNTKAGADYLIAGPPQVEEPEEPVKPCPKKGKGKKKGCKKKDA